MKRIDEILLMALAVIFLSIAGIYYFIKESISELGIFIKDCFLHFKSMIPWPSKMNNEK